MRSFNALCTFLILLNEDGECFDRRRQSESVGSEPALAAGYAYAGL